MCDKWHFFENKDFVWHLDDDSIENELINDYTKTKAISSICSFWKQNCERLL